MGESWCFYEARMWTCMIIPMFGISVWGKPRFIHLGLCGFQGVMCWPLRQRISKVACLSGLLSIWVRATLWNGSAMCSLSPARAAPVKGEAKCLVSSRARLPEELCAVFWPHTDFLSHCFPWGSASTLPFSRLGAARVSDYFSGTASVQGSNTYVNSNDPITCHLLQMKQDSIWMRALQGWLACCNLWRRWLTK